MKQIDIEISIGKEIPSNDWMRVANKRAKALAADSGKKWVDLHIYVQLPERGRCFVKHPGELGLSSYG